MSREVLIKGEIKDFVTEKRNEYNLKQMKFILKEIFGVELSTRNLRGYYNHNDLEYKKEKPLKSISHKFMKTSCYEYKDKNNVVYCKTKEQKWITKARYLYEQATGKKLKSNESIYFIDGNNNNFDIANMKVVNKTSRLIVNGTFNRKLNKELVDATYKVVDLIVKTKEKEKERIKEERKKEIEELEKQAKEKLKAYESTIPTAEEKRKKRNKNWRDNNKEYLKEYMKEYTRTNKEKISKQKKEYRAINREKYNEYMKTYRKRKKGEIV